MAVKINSVIVTPNPVVIVQTFTITVGAEDVTWNTIKTEFQSWNAIKTSLTNWNRVENYT